MKVDYIYNQDVPDPKLVFDDLAVGDVFTFDTEEVSTTDWNMKTSRKQFVRLQSGQHCQLVFVDNEVRRVEGCFYGKVI